MAFVLVLGTVFMMNGILKPVGKETTENIVKGGQEQTPTEAQRFPGRWVSMKLVSYTQGIRLTVPHDPL